MQIKNIDSDMELFMVKLKKNKLKATPQRIAVHQAMLTLGHACADMVTEQIKKENTVSITTASVYNILTNLAQIGIYNYRMSTNNKMYFDVNVLKHLHLYDCENHLFKDVIDDDLFELLENHFANRKFRGYKLEGFDIQLIARPTKKKITKKNL